MINKQPFIFTLCSVATRIREHILVFIISFPFSLKPNVLFTAFYPLFFQVSILSLLFKCPSILPSFLLSVLSSHLQSVYLLNYQRCLSPTSRLAKCISLLPQSVPPSLPPSLPCTIYSRLRPFLPLSKHSKLNKRCRSLMMEGINMRSPLR